MNKAIAALLQGCDVKEILYRDDDTVIFLTPSNALGIAFEKGVIVRSFDSWYQASNKEFNGC